MASVLMRSFPSLVLLVSLLLPAALFPQQPRHADVRTDDRHDNFGRRLESMIDRFLQNIHEEFSETGNDTIPPVRNSRDDSDIDQWQTPSTTTFDGDATIGEDEIITGNVVVKAGNLTVFGRVEGDVLVVGGTLYVKNGARITGNARVINGDVVREEEGVVEGYIDQTTASTASYRYDRGRFTRSGYRFEVPWSNPLTNLDNFIYHFNRVEGHFIGLGSEKRYYWDGARTISPYGFIGWGFKSHRWRGMLGVDRQFSIESEDENAGRILEFGIEG
ncbi:MAG: polymer-forming cytoskeletal protein, partial [Ignavibacterium sp.]